MAFEVLYLYKSFLLYLGCGIGPLSAFESYCSLNQKSQNSHTLSDATHLGSTEQGYKGLLVSNLYFHIKYNIWWKTKEL